MISIFTPSHDPKYLDKCYESLVAQTIDNWEWVVVLNGDAKWTKPDDKRVVTYRLEGGKGVGYYKAEAVNWCTGDIFVELDHDDMLMPDALNIVDWVFSRHAEVGFVYSDFAQIDEFGMPNHDKFDLRHGWDYYTDGDYLVTDSFPPHPHNMGYIWYAPNHLRAFRAKTYRKVGGYDRHLDVLDDQDLMARMFEAAEVYHVRECLYLQRIHGGNTQKRADLNAKIQTETVQMYTRTIEDMALEWAEREGLYALDLGAYHNKADGFTGVDLRSSPNVDIVGDFLELDLPPNSVGVIRAYDFMEHIQDKIAFIEKVYELLCHGGMLLSMTPSSDGRGAFQDPTHVAFYNINSFWYYTDRQYADFIDTDVRFQVSALDNVWPTQWHADNNIPYVRANLIAVKEVDARHFGGILSI